MEIYAEIAMSILDELHTERRAYHSEYVLLADAINRLAAYEETGLDPEDMKRAFNEDAILKLAGQALGMSPDRLRELAQAEKEGRLVVLPCEIGSPVYSHARKLDGADYVRETEFWWSDIPQMGKTVFLTREAAEAALEEREAEHDKHTPDKV